MPHIVLQPDLQIYICLACDETVSQRHAHAPMFFLSTRSTQDTVGRVGSLQRYKAQ